MRKISWLVLLTLCLGAVALPAGAQAVTCNGLEPTQPPGDLLYGTEGDDVLVGTEGADRIFTEGGNDAVCALGGDDVVSPGLGDDYVDGGGGSDDLWLTEFVQGTAGTLVDLRNGTATGPEGSDELVVGSLENVEMNCSATTADTLIGDDDDNIFSGGSGADVLQGGAGHDVLYGTDTYYGKTDAICWNGDGDDDVLAGGAGDDLVWGQAGPDQLDGGAGWDIVVGGDDSDRCANGERYSTCETEDPPPPPPECSDGINNDEDEEADLADSGCSHPDDPREEGNDPGCNDGIDNDGDDRVDFPGDGGCQALADDTELDHCIGPCPRPYLTIEYKPGRKMFRGKLHFGPTGCDVGRRVLLRKKRDGQLRTVARDRTNRNAVWKVDRRRPRGRFYAVVRATQVTLSGGEVVQCPWVRSPSMRIQT